MNADVDKLLELQQVDAEIARLNAEVAALPKQLQAIEAKLADAKSQVEKAKAAVKADEMARRKYESDIQAQHEKIRKFREQSSSVKTNEQYKALLQEIEFAEKEIRGFEDKILELMESAEKRERDVKAAETELKAQTAEIEKEKNNARAVTEQDSKKLADESAKRNELRQGIDESLLTHYERVSKLRRTGLAEARNQRCVGCQVMLRPQVFAEVRNGNVQICDSCSRILYYVPESAGEANAAAAPASGSVERTWIFLPDVGEHGAFASLSNVKSGASIRTWDALTGQLLEKHVEKGKIYKEAYADKLERGRPIFVDQADLEDRCKDGMPEEILDELRRQVPNL